VKEFPPILEARNLQVIRGGALLVDVPSLFVADGEILSLIGPNGAGKTTLLLALSCLIKSSQGEIIFKGERVDSSHSILEYRRKLAMVFQEPLLFDATVSENVASGLKIRGMDRSNIRVLVAKQLERFGIGHLKDRSARTLSGGEAQRTSLARAFATKPEILFLDEPFASLDPPTRESLIDDLEVIFRETKKTGIMATHDRMEALMLSHRIAVMNGGKILQIGASGAVMNHPVDEFVASFVGTETILSGKVIGGHVGTISVTVSGQTIEAMGEAVAGERVVLCIRPENVTLSANPSSAKTSERNLFPGKVEKIILMGLFYKAQLDCGFPLVAYVTNPSLEQLSLRVGSRVAASFKASSIHVIKKGRT
jgi:tungstate transport system ATP-binding protein